MQNIFNQLGNIMSAALNASQIKKNNAESNQSDAMTESLKTNTQIAQDKFQNWLDNRKDVENKLLEQQFYEQVERSWQARIQSLKSPIEVDQAKQELEHTKAKIQNVLSQTTSITFDVYKAQYLLPYERRKYISEINSNIQQANLFVAQGNLAKAEESLTRTKNYFTKMGFGIGNNWVTSLMAVAASPEAKDIIPRITSNITQMIQSVATEFDKNTNDSSFNLSSSYPLMSESLKSLMPFPVSQMLPFGLWFASRFKQRFGK